MPMTSDVDHVIDPVFGSGRSQSVYADGERDVFGAVGGYPTHATEFADRPDVDREQAYRLLRALGSLGSLGSLEGTGDRRFSSTSTGTFLRADSPGSLRAKVRREEGRTHYALWKHLPDIVLEAEQNAIDRGFGADGVFECLEESPEYANHLANTDREYDVTHYPENERMGAVEGVVG